MIFISLLIFLLYGFLVLRYILANRRDELKTISKVESKTVSVVIPYRNEAVHIKKLTQSLFSQDYPKELLEFIFIDDHSNDRSTTILESCCKSIKFECKILSLSEETGKKAALKKGVESSNGEVVLTSDADCTMGTLWVSSMINCIANPNKEFLIGPVKLERGNSIFTALQQIEFAAVMACTSGSAILGKPISCNGANLGFTRSLYEKVKPYNSNLQVASGDDMFFLFAAKNSLKNSEIAFVSSPDALVKTQVISSLRGFISQRIRWVKKSRYFEDWDSKKFGLVLMMMNLLLFTQLMSSLVFDKLYWLVILSFFVKYFLDTCLLFSIRRWNPIGNIILKSFYLSLVYPFYLLSIALLSLLTRSKWKGR